jgi:uncharacterized protein
MRVWLDLSNSPHVPLLDPIARRLRERGHDVTLTARDHAQTLELAIRRWPELLVIGAESPAQPLAKGRAIARRAEALRRFARERRPDVAFSHGSYAQLLAARLAGVPAVTMMDYEHQPANHLSFRLARRVIVPEVFPEPALRRFGAWPRKVVRYPGFKEQLYIESFIPDPTVVDELGLRAHRVIAVLRPPAEGALYHRMANERFTDLVRLAAYADGVEAVLLPRTREQAERYRAIRGVRVPDRAVDGGSLLAAADLTIGAGGTMTRESAVLGTATYTVFAARQAAVDKALVRMGRLHDLRAPGSRPAFVKKDAVRRAGNGASEPILNAVVETIEDAAS